MQTHKKDIVWPDAGVVRKRGSEWRQRGKNPLASLLSCNLSPSRLFNKIKIVLEWVGCFFHSDLDHFKVLECTNSISTV